MATRRTPGAPVASADEMTWLERLATDASLPDFVSAEIARAGIELDTLRWQRDQHRQQIASLTSQLAAAKAEITRLRRLRGASADEARLLDTGRSDDDAA